ncbi:hypothetical protein K9M47_00550 [Candidatus Gracilibacteria bacterium]|nr:hypothetical protein [Candidatus Gracilibacteria bacterium]MCF7898632.1 hypothetical protein [Candidatus Paceibacterota bacterium]
MDPEIKNKIEEQSIKINAIYLSVEKTRKYFLVTMWVTIIAIVLPIIGLGLMVPTFLSSYSEILNVSQ